MQNDDSSNSSFLTPAFLETLFCTVLRAGAVPFEVFLHRGMGWAYPGLPGIVALVVQFVFCLVTANNGIDPTPIMLFGGVYLVVLIFRRAQSAWLARGGAKPHSSYAGDCILERWLPWFSERFVRQTVEPLLVAGTGVAFASVAPALMLYFLMGGFCMRMCIDLSNMQMNQRARAMHDQLIEQQMVAERFRDISGRRF